MSKRHFLVTIFCGITLIFQPIGLFAQSTSTFKIPQDALDAGFNHNLVLDDSDIFGLQGMTLTSVQQFLESRPGTLGTKKLQDIDGIEKPASSIIWRVATSYKINPRYLMALLQKEQSLVDDPNPTQKQFDWATGYAICDSCSMNDPTLQGYKGFASQLEWAAKQHRERYLLQMLSRGTTIGGQAPGKTTKINGIEVTPANQATAMLYSYTPHIAGNLSLWRIWRRWFSTTLPEGTFAQGKTSKQIYLIRLGTKRPIKSRAVAASLVDTEKIVQVDDGQLSAYPVGPTIKFANYSLVETPDKKRYLIVNDRKRLIASAAAFARFGFNEDEIIDATLEDIAGYEEGPDITTKTTYPNSLLAKDAKGNYWYVENETRALIPNKTFLSLYFKGRTAKLLSATALAKLPIVDPYQLKDGELVRDTKNPAVYVIENGKRRPIASGEVFEQLGWKWKNVVSLPKTILDDYALGAPIDGLNRPTLAVAGTPEE